MNYDWSSLAPCNTITEVWQFTARKAPPGRGSHLAYLMQTFKPFTVRVLNVPPPVKSARLSRSRQSGSKRSSNAARRSAILDEAGTAYSYEVEPGPVPEIIARYVSEHKGYAIIMGSRGMSAFSNLLMGSIATKVLHLTDYSVRRLADSGRPSRSPMTSRPTAG